MKLDEEGRLLYVFKVDDPWIKELREIFMGPLGWDPEEFDGAWTRSNDLPSMFCQLMVVYRYLGMTPSDAVDMLLMHPDYAYLKEIIGDGEITS